jgi:hypothetical protein
MALPHYAVAWRHILDYFYINVFSREAHIWELDLSPFEHLTYHWLGPGGKLMLGTWRWTIPLFWILALAAVLVRRDRRAAAFSAVFGITFMAAYLAVSLPHHKTVYLGAVVPGLAVCGWLAAAGYLCGTAKLLRSAHRSAVVVALSLAFLVGLSTYRWHRDWIYPAKDENAREAAATARKAIAEVVNGVGTTHRSLFLTGASPYLNATSMSFYLKHAGAMGSIATDLNRGKDIQAYRESLDRADAVVVFAPNTPALIPNLPSSDPGLQKQLLDILCADSTFPDMDRLDTYPGSGEADGWLFRRHTKVAVPTDVEGFSEVSNVLYGFGSGSVLRLENLRRDAILLMEAATGLDHQTLTVSVNGTPVLERALARTEGFQPFRIALTPMSGHAVIAFRYAKWYAATKRPPGRTNASVVLQGLRTFAPDEVVNRDKLACNGPRWSPFR